MNLLTAIVVGVLVGSGVYLMTRDDLTRLVAGTLLITNGAILLLVSAGFRARVAPVPTEAGPALIADPVVQALALTAVVINFAATVLLMRVLVAVESTHRTLSAGELESSQSRDEAQAEVEAASGS